jgi:hypothetical protein
MVDFLYTTVNKSPDCWILEITSQAERWYWRDYENE